MPAILTVVIFTFTLTLQEFVYALTFVSSSDQKPITLGVSTDLIRAFGLAASPGPLGYLIRTQAPLLADDLSAASMNFTPARPSSMVGKITARSCFLPVSAARMARAASA